MTQQTDPKIVNSLLLRALAFISLALGLLTACSSAGPPAPSPTNVTVGPLVAMPTAVTPVPTGLPTQEQRTPTMSATERPTSVVPATRAAAATEDAQYLADIRTKYAQYTAVPIPTLGPPEPTPTWVLGFLGGCSNLPGYYAQMYGCWRGMYNGELIGVSGGRQGTSGNRRQGLLMVFHGPLFDPMAATTEVYSTPHKIGGIRLVSVEGSRVTLISYDFPAILYTPTPLVSPTPGPMFLFDLATRQWIGPDGTPLPTPSASLAPGQSPLPSPSVGPAGTP